MHRLQAYKYEPMPNRAQPRNMRRFSGACRFVFSKALALQKANTQAGEKFIGYVVMAKRLTDWRNGSETPWLQAAPCHPLQHALQDLERTYKNVFAKRTDFPRFKRKGSGERFRCPDAKQFKLDQANPKMARIGHARRDDLHKTLTTINQNHAFVCIKDLQVRNMSKSAAGDTEQL